MRSQSTHVHELPIVKEEEKKMKKKMLMKVLFNFTVRTVCRGGLLRRMLGCVGRHHSSQIVTAKGEEYRRNRNVKNSPDGYAGLHI